MGGSSSAPLDVVVNFQVQFAFTVFAAAVSGGALWIDRQNSRATRARPHDGGGCGGRAAAAPGDVQSA